MIQAGHALQDRCNAPGKEEGGNALLKNTLVSCYKRLMLWLAIKSRLECSLNRMFRGSFHSVSQKLMDCCRLTGRVPMDS